MKTQKGANFFSKCDQVRMKLRIWSNLRKKLAHFCVFINFIRIENCTNKLINFIDYLGQSIQEWTKSNLWKAAFKKFDGI